MDVVADLFEEWGAGLAVTAVIGAFIFRKLRVQLNPIR